MTEPKPSEPNLAGEIVAKATKVMHSLVNLLADSPNITAAQALDAMRAQLVLVLAPYDVELVLDPACVVEYAATGGKPARVEVKAVLETDWKARKVHVRPASDDQMLLAYQVAHWREAIKLMLTAAIALGEFDLPTLLQRGRAGLLEAFEGGNATDAQIAKLQADVNVVRAAAAYVEAVNAQVAKQ